MAAAGATDQQTHGSGDLGDAADKEEVAASQAATGGGGARPIFPSRPTRPQGSKAAKADLHEQSRRDAILKTQALAAEQMAKANMRKAEAMGDHAAMSLFRTPIEDVDEDAREYFKLRRKEELERIKWRMEHEERQAEKEKLDHEKLMRDRAAEEHRSKRPRQQSKTCAEVPPQSQPEADPILSPTPNRSEAPTPATPGPVAPAEDSALHRDLGEWLSFFFHS
jgi:hypothetical protein